MSSEPVKESGAPVTFTEQARARIQEVIATGDDHGRHLRIAAVRTHCMGGRGFTYRLAFEASPSEDDEVFEDHGVSVCMDQASSPYLRGARMDYAETVQGTGFKLDNPNAVAKCPCGHHDIFE